MHLAVAEAVDDASSAASRLHSSAVSLLSSLTFRKLTSAAQREAATGGSGGGAAAAAAATLQTAQVEVAAAGAAEGELSFGEASEAAALRKLASQQRRAADGAAEAGGGDGGAGSAATNSDLARVTDGPLLPGGSRCSAQGRLDFVLQASSSRCVPLAPLLTSAHLCSLQACHVPACLGAALGRTVLSSSRRRPAAPTWAALTHLAALLRPASGVCAAEQPPLG